MGYLPAKPDVSLKPMVNCYVYYSDAGGADEDEDVAFGEPRVLYSLGRAHNHLLTTNTTFTLPYLSPSLNSYMYIIAVTTSYNTCFHQLIRLKLSCE